MLKTPKLPKGVTQADFDELNKRLDRKIDEHCLGDDVDEESEDTKFFNKQMKKFEKQKIAEKKKFYGKAYGTKVGGEIKEESTEEEEEEKPKENEFNHDDAKKFMKELSEYVMNTEIMDDGMLKKIKGLKDRLERVKTIDVVLAEKIKGVFKNNELCDTEEYDELQKALLESDIILHFKEADKLAKLNTKDPLGFLLNMVERKEEFKEGKNFYEVIRKDGPQKIMLISSGKLAGKYRLIRRYILNYMKSKGCPVEKRDIKCLKNNQTGNMEILITPYYVKNTEDKNAFVSSLKKYIEEIDGDEKVIDLLDKKNMESSEIKGTKCNLLPYQKQYVNGDPINFKTTDGMVDLIVSAITKECKRLDVKPDGNLVINVNIGTLNNIMGNNSGSVGNIVVNISDPYEKLIADLKEQKPSWYITNKYISKKELYRRFMGMMITEVTNNVFWHKMKKKLIEKEKRAGTGGDREMQIKLKKLWE